MKYADIQDVITIDSNTLKYWGVLVTSFLIGYVFMGSILYFILITFIAAMGLDFLYYLGGVAYYDPSEAIARGYTASAFMNDTLHSQGIDYGFNFYDGDYDKPPKQAQIDKFKFAIKSLGIRKGDRVIDIGCGCGDWLYYLQTEMKCKVVGVNITNAQAIECHKRGLTVYVTDWKLIEKSKELVGLTYGKFDVVTCWDTVEHYVSMGEGLGRRYNRNKIYQQLFRLVNNLYDPKSRLKRCWISCLHMRRSVYTGLFSSNWSKLFYIYLLDKFHSGFYPSYYKESDGVFYDGLADNAKKVGFKVIERKDVTKDYYMTSIIEETHFGRHRFKMTFPRVVFLLCSTLLDPYWFHRILWFYQESWMIQFDPKDVDNSDVILWWLTFQK